MLTGKKNSWLRRSPPFLFCLFILFSLLLSGCRGTITGDTARNQDNESSITAVSYVPPLVGAILAPTDSPAAAGNGQVTAALRSLKEQYGVRVRAISPTDFLTPEEALGYFGVNEARAVVIADPAFAGFVPAAQEKFQKTTFIYLGLPEERTLETRLAGAYLAGALAGAMLPGGSVTVDIPPGETEAAAFERVIRAGLAETGKRDPLLTLTTSIGGGTVPGAAAGAGSESAAATADLRIILRAADMPPLPPGTGRIGNVIVLLQPNEAPPPGVWSIQGGVNSNDLYPRLEAILKGKEGQPSLLSVQWNIFMKTVRATEEPQPLPEEIRSKLEPVLQKLAQGEVHFNG
ncbi:conserved hypothetical protein [Heliomicrobium modesticaldum Ice1]|uniref:Uncharacterized protein n=1 Tax=Heliobacterium modesticaldum (strain ATCC 51547 / Ice1) TaxID=498761 RepID=B0THT8_HELMI|nr:hypothetical protein [Heliomicrobium modesticaldum]ABZ84871.1 conserved hypothetical protein [Heliomicrobium modesticaldum Ice1]